MVGVGPVAWDLCYFMAMSVEPSWETDVALLQTYYDSLVQTNPRIADQFSFDRLLEHMMLGMTCMFTAAMKVRIGLPLDPNMSANLHLMPPKVQDFFTGMIASMHRLCLRLIQWNERSDRFPKIAPLFS